LWKIKEEQIYGFSEFPQASEFLNLNQFQCEKKLKLCYFSIQPQMLDEEFWNNLCAILMRQ